MPNHRKTKKTERKRAHGKSKKQGLRNIIAVIFVLIIIAAVYTDSTRPSMPTPSTFNSTGIISTKILSEVVGNWTYNVTSSAIPAFNLDNSSSSRVYGEEQIFSLYGTAPSSVPPSISITLLNASDSSTAKTELISILFGATPSSKTDGYISNSSNPLENSAVNRIINGVNITFYNIYQNTNSSGLPLYGKTVISPPVFQYVTVFVYPETNIVSEIITTSSTPLSNGSDISFKLAESLARKLAS